MVQQLTALMVSICFRTFSSSSGVSAAVSLWARMAIGTCSEGTAFNWKKWHYRYNVFLYWRFQDETSGRHALTASGAGLVTGSWHFLDPWKLATGSFAMFWKKMRQLAPVLLVWHGPYFCSDTVVIWLTISPNSKTWLVFVSFLTILNWSCSVSVLRSSWWIREQ